MNITRVLAAVYVYPEHMGRVNVIRRVDWFLCFEEGGFRSDAFIETTLDVDNITNFIPANQVGNDRVLQWAFDAQGGEGFVDLIRGHHADEIAQKKAIAQLQSYVDGFSFDLPSALPVSVL